MRKGEKVRSSFSFGQTFFKSLKIKAFIVYILLTFLLIGITSAGVELTITPRAVTVQPGEIATVTYTIEVKSITDVNESVTLYIKELAPGFSYTFSNPEFDLAPGETKTSYLYVDAPYETTPGQYKSKVAAHTTVPGFQEFIKEESYFTIKTLVPHEVPAITLPLFVLIILITLLILIFRPSIFNLGGDKK